MRKSSSIFPRIMTAFIALNVQISLPVLAALDDFEAPSKTTLTNQFDYVYSSSKSEEMQRKSKLVEATSSTDSFEGASTSSTDGERYKASLAKERAKADAISKKSKAEKRRDLCEELGRGC